MKQKLSSQNRVEMARFQIRPDFMEHLHEGCQIIGWDWRYRYVNQMAERHNRRTKEELLNHRMQDCYPGIETSPLFTWLQECMQSRLSGTMESELRYPDGETAWFELVTAPVPDGLFVLSIDITNRMNVTRELIETLNLNQLILDSMQDGILVVSVRDYRIRLANRALGRMLGRSEDQLVHLTLRDIHSEADWPTIERLFLDCAHRSEAMLRAIPMLRSDGMVFPADLNISSITMMDEDCLLGVVRDISVIREMEADQQKMRSRLAITEEQLHHSQKLESIGLLANGIAHDFNNILTVQLNICDSVLDSLHAKDPLREDIAQVRDSAERAASLTHQLLAFGRQQPLRPRVVNLSEQIRKLAPMLQRLIGEDITLEFRLSDALPAVFIDPGQFEQVLLNLVVNARGAMPTGGRLTLESTAIELDEAYAAVHAEAHGGPHVMLAVSDTGCGMDREIQKRIFEPFFTTKPHGQGSGLGLSTVYGIVKQSGGSIWVYSEPGQGSTFKIYLPVVAAGIDSPPPAELAVEFPLMDGRDRLILVVEDETLIRNLVAQMLSGRGFRVAEAADGEEALRMIREAHFRPDLLITDIVMPGMSGQALVEQLKESLPDLIVLYTSGYTDNVVVHHGITDHRIEFLQKPFTRKSLFASVESLFRKTAVPGREV